MMNLVRASAWEITDWVLTKRAQFNCGSCKKLNRKMKVFYQGFTNMGPSPLVLSQCQWCGEINSFFQGERPIVLDV